jgi:hypothetical protein
MNRYSLNQEDFDTIIELRKFHCHSNHLDGIQPAFKTKLIKAYKQNEQYWYVFYNDFTTICPPSWSK